MEDNVFADIVKTEVEERPMLKWLQTLGLHSFEARHFEHLAPPGSEANKRLHHKPSQTTKRKNEDEDQESAKVEKVDSAAK